MNKPRLGGCRLLELDDHPDRVTLKDLGNFWHKFAGGSQRVQELSSEKREISYGEANLLNACLFSEKLKVQTPVQFYHAIDLATIGAGEDIERFGEELLRIPRITASGIGDDYAELMIQTGMAKSARERFGSRIIPVYLNLRREGYNHYDLRR